MEQPQNVPPPAAVLARVFGLEPGEIAAVAWSFVYFFCLLSAYYMLRSVRDSMAIVSGVENIPWLFTGTFFSMLLLTPVFGWIASRYPRRQFLPWVYYFFILNIVVFFAVFTFARGNNLDLVWISRIFFVWLSVFNLFVVSVFWSFMADIYTREQGRRLFGVISAGGSTGALLGPIATGLLVEHIGFQNLFPLSALLLLFAVYCIFRLRRWVRERDADGAASEAARAIGGSAFAGIRLVFTTPYFAAIAASLAAANFLGVAVYIYMAELVRDSFDTTDKQTQVFAFVDAMINGLSFIGQLFIVKLSVRRLGVGFTLAWLPIVSVVGFALLALNPVFIVMALFQVLRRAITFGLSKPTNDMLYSVVSPEAKYKAKNFIETTVYRGWDWASSWLIKFMGGIGVSGVAMVCVPIALAWAVLAFWIGREYNRRDENLPQGEIA